MKHSFPARMLSLAMALSLVIALMPAAFASSEPQIAAKSAIVIDYDTGDVLYKKDPDALRAPASMTKVMTAYIIFEELEAGRLTLDTQVPISERAAKISKDKSYPSSVPLTAGSTLSVDTLLKLILLPSASASCIVMAEYIAGSEDAFVVRMNETAHRLGMTAAFKNCHGARPHDTTARSVAVLVREFIHRYPQILQYTSLPSMEFEGRTLHNTNHFLSKAPYAGCDGFKTGTIPEAGFCLAATAQRKGHRIISVVMGSTDNPHRYSDSAAILDYGFASIQNNSRYFADIGRSWARPQIERLSDSGIALHTRNGFFRPNEPTTRAEFTAMLISALEPRGVLDGKTPLESPAFCDIETSWAAPEIRRAAALGIVNGTKNGQFQPDAPITREEAMTILDRALTLPEAGAVSFTDASSISDWALPAVERIAAQGLFRGDPAGQIHPQNRLMRCEAAAVFCNLIDLVPQLPAAPPAVSDPEAVPAAPAA